MSFAIIFIMACAWGSLSKYLFYARGWNFHFPKADPDGFWGKNGYRNKYKKWHEAISNKWLLEPAPNRWYYKWNHLKYKERFPGSATVFVAYTDVHHFAQLLITRVIFVALAAPWDQFWQALAVYVLIWSFGFNLTFLWRNDKTK